MASKSFKIPPQYKKLILYFRDLKQNAWQELKENDIQEEPAQAKFGDLQDICERNPVGALAKYVTELQKCFRMSPEELLAYSNGLKHPQKPKETSIPPEMEVSNDWDFEVAEDLGMSGISEDWEGFGEFDEPDEEEDLWGVDR